MNDIKQQIQIFISTDSQTLFSAALEQDTV